MSIRYLELAGRAIELRLPDAVDDDKAARLSYSWRFTESVTSLPVIASYSVLEETLPFPSDAPLHLSDQGPKVARDPEHGGWLVGTAYGRSDQWQLRARVSEDFSEGTIYSRVEEDGSYRPYPLEFPIRPMVIFNLLARHGIGVLHSSQVDLGGSSLLFSGHSGAGKTTAGRLWREAGYPTLNDEMNLLYVEDGVAMVASTPWNGDYVTVTQSVQPLEGIFFLHQTPDNFTKRLNPIRATSRLLANSFSQMAFKSEFETVMDAFGQIGGLTPVYELHNTADQRTISVVKQALASASVTA